MRLIPSLLMCFSALMSLSTQANSTSNEENGDVVKLLPYKISQNGRIDDISVHNGSIAFLLSPPENSFILRNSLKVEDTNSKEFPLKVISKLSLSLVGGTAQLSLNTPFRVVVDANEKFRKSTFIYVTYTACTSNDACYMPIQKKVLLND